MLMMICLRSKTDRRRRRRISFFCVLFEKLPEGLALLPPHLLAYEKSQIQRAETKWNKRSGAFFRFFQVRGERET
jgi:hypothetical protein